MDPRNLSFMTAVLGSDGAAALAKAVARSEDLSHALVPRTIVAWLQSASMYEGALPGVEGSFVAFEKHDTGFTGRIQVGASAGLHEFENAPLFHVAGAVAVALGLDHGEVPERVRDLDLDRLGKSIDVLVKAKRLHVELAKKKVPAKKTKEELEKEELEKTGTGVPAAPTPPKPPTAPTPPNTTPAKPPAPKPPKLPKSPGAPTMKLTRSEADRECASCGIPQFHRNVFRGCLCFSAFAKSVKVVSADDSGLVVRFDPSDWGPDELLTLRESMGLV